jgi:hypothetical protein
MTDSALQPYDLRDQGRLMHDIASRRQLVPDSAHLALVRDPSTEQQVVRVERLGVPAEILDWQRLATSCVALSRVGRSRPVDAPGNRPVLVVARPGLCVFGPNEGAWLMADR